MEQLALTYEVNEGAVNEGSHLKQVARPPSTALQVSSNKMDAGTVMLRHGQMMQQMASLSPLAPYRCSGVPCGA
jgi:hypothetical protein